MSASVNGGNAAAGAVGASAAELAAQYLIKQLPKDQYPEAIDPRTGEIDPNRLPENVKASIRDLSSAVATVSGGLTGGSLIDAQIAGVVGQNAVENNQFDLIQLISPASAAMLSKDAKHREAMKIAHQIRMASSAITIVQVGGGYAIAGVGLVAPEAIGAIYSACRVNPAGCTVVTVESADILAGLATGAVTVNNLPASAIKSTSKIGGKYAEEIGQIGKEASKGSAKAGKGIVVVNDLKPHEIQQAQRIIDEFGGGFEGVPKLTVGSKLNGKAITSSDYPVIDGWYTAASGEKFPVSLKEITSSNPLAILQDVSKANKTGKEFNILDATMYVDAKNMSSEQLIKFAKNGPLSGNALQQGVINQIIVKTKDGFVTIKPKSVLNSKPKGW
nr:VENN motif pre-toxin domain-containing protein [Snodgrassella alvi]